VVQAGGERRLVELRRARRRDERAAVRKRGGPRRRLLQRPRALLGRGAAHGGRDQRGVRIPLRQQRAHPDRDLARSGEVAEHGPRVAARPAAIAGQEQHGRHAGSRRTRAAPAARTGRQLDRRRRRLGEQDLDAALTTQAREEHVLGVAPAAELEVGTDALRVLDGVRLARAQLVVEVAVDVVVGYRRRRGPDLGA